MLLRASLQNDVEARIRKVRQIRTTTCWCISGIRAYMLWAEDGVHSGFWAGDHFVGKLLSGGSNHAPTSHPLSGVSARRHGQIL